MGCVLACSGCYLTHLPGGEDDGRADEAPSPPGGRSPSIRGRESQELPARPKHVRPTLPPVQCTAQPTPACVSSFPRIMIVMDASSSMLAGRLEGDNNWDKARFALAGNPKVTDRNDPRYVQPAFARELEVRGNVITMEDVFHLGLLVFNAEDEQRVLLQYTPCAADNIAWAMDPYVSCEEPGCDDPYGSEPIWTYKNSDVDRNPPFVATTLSYMPPCNAGARVPCVGNMFNTFTAEGLELAADNILAYKRDSLGFDLAPGTRFANILITDGDTSPGSQPEVVLERMRNDGVPTYVIGLAPQGPGADVQRALDQLDRYAQEGGTEYATLVRASEVDIADAFAEAVTRIIDDLGTDPCCTPNHCEENPEPPAPLQQPPPVGAALAPRVSRRRHRAPGRPTAKTRTCMRSSTGTSLKQ